MRKVETRLGIKEHEIVKILAKRYNRSQAWVVNKLTVAGISRLDESTKITRDFTGDGDGI